MSQPISVQDRHQWHRNCQIL